MRSPDPDDLQRGVVHGGEEPRGLGAGRDVQPLVLDADDERTLAGEIGQLAQRGCDAIKTRLGSTEHEKYADDASPHTLGDVERAARSLG
jgi:hypothetical protein